MHPERVIYTVKVLIVILFCLQKIFQIAILRFLGFVFDDIRSLLMVV